MNSSNSVTWRGVADMVHPKIGWRNWPRLWVRFVAIVAVTLALLPPFLLLRLIDQLVPNGHYGGIIARLWARVFLRLVGLQVQIHGEPSNKAGAIVANHSSWLDILALVAIMPCYFVAKAEVSRWPGIGVIARLSGTEFIERNTRAAAKHKARLHERLLRGQRMCFFPEGTSSDGLRILPFKSTLFAPFLEIGGEVGFFLQPVSISYQAEASLPESFYGLWGNAALFTHLVAVLALSRRGNVIVTFHQPIDVSTYTDRKVLAQDSSETVRRGFENSRAVRSVAPHMPQ